MGAAADDVIIPDDKDWTWVLERPCPECGFVASDVSVEDVPRLIEDNAALWRQVLAGDLVEGDVTARPQPDVWSPLEYACHVRDVFRIFDTRLHLMLDAGPEGATFENWDQDETAVADRYGEQDPAVVARELDEAAATLATSFTAVTPDQHGNVGLRSNGSRFTVTTFAQYLVHDPVHHIWDVTAP